MSPAPTPQRPSQTKIVATIGPATDSEEQLAELIAAGVDVFRLNMAHGNRAEHERVLDAIRSAARGMDRIVGVLVDLAGPKIRLGELPEGKITCDDGAVFRFVRGDESREPGQLVTTYERLVDELTVGDRVVLADGSVTLTVTEAGADYAECRVVQSGEIRSRQGVNLPGVKLSVPALGPADLDNAAWAAGAGIDFVGLSFVRAAEEIRQLKAHLASHTPDDADSTAQVIAKIEKPEALENLEEIVQAADGLMVARGDLGVEIDIARVAVVQKEIIATCHRHCKPVITATQMLDSMQRSRIPSRAEVTDVANAILDGSDACMLSGETAIGRYPRQAVEMMHRIALATEPMWRRREQPLSDTAAQGIDPITWATVGSAGRLAERLDAKMVVVASVSGATALALSKNRYFVPTVGLSDSPATLRRMCLYWGVIPVADVPTDDNARLLEAVVDRATSAGHLSQGDRLVLVSGTGLSVTAHNAIVVHEIP